MKRTKELSKPIEIFNSLFTVNGLPIMAEVREMKVLYKHKGIEHEETFDIYCQNQVSDIDIKCEINKTLKSKLGNSFTLFAIFEIIPSKHKIRVIYTSKQFLKKVKKKKINHKNEKL